MLKTLAILRTAFLVFMLGYAAVIWFRSFGMVSACDLQLRRCAQISYSLSWAVGLAIVWIGLETLLGWWVSHRASRKAGKVAAAAPPLSPGRT